MIEKAQNTAMEFATVFDLHLDSAPGGEQVEVIKTANSLATCVAKALVNTKGITRFAANDDEMESRICVGKNSGDVAIRFFNSLISYWLSVLPPGSRKDVVIKGKGITNAIAQLIAAATKYQAEILAQGKGSSLVQAFYKCNNHWTEGLISPAKQAAYSTTLPIKTADGVISGAHTLDQLIVALNEVAAATAQLVQASVIKAELKNQNCCHLERQQANLKKLSLCIGVIPLISRLQLMKLFLNCLVPNLKLFNYHQNNPLQPQRQKSQFFIQTPKIL
ncbi:hypothetical protein O181_085027 [Austropuccinia psidii MF-1]|uniref:I/LWEQ domain-containing protein n=1 Tax=Austropuccinia psidii MF-1 TaxID=1389203 RepID=A0A9Q3FXB4_9BASI|nr:hypothetical protein [Austropuccinia psidii MF-1]